MSPKIDRPELIPVGDNSGTTRPDMVSKSAVLADGTTHHGAGADINQDGKIDAATDAAETFERHKDGTSERKAVWQNGDGTRTRREARLDADGKTKSTQEEVFDKDGKLISGEYDLDGDGKIDMEQQDLNGDGKLETIDLSSDVGTRHFAWEGKGEWNIDADGDGDSDWNSSVDTTGKDYHTVDFVDNGKSLGSSFAWMHEGGINHSTISDNDGDGYKDHRTTINSDAEGNITSQINTEWSDDAQHRVIDEQRDTDGDGDLDSWKRDVDNDGDLDTVRLDLDDDQSSLIHEDDSSEYAFRGDMNASEGDSSADTSWPMGDSIAAAFGLDLGIGADDSPGETSDLTDQIASATDNNEESAELYNQDEDSYID